MWCWKLNQEEKCHRQHQFVEWEGFQQLKTKIRNEPAIWANRCEQVNKQAKSKIECLKSITKTKKPKVWAWVEVLRKTKIDCLSGSKSPKIWRTSKTRTITKSKKIKKSKKFRVHRHQQDKIRNCPNRVVLNLRSWANLGKEREKWPKNKN